MNGKVTANVFSQSARTSMRRATGEMKQGRNLTRRKIPRFIALSALTVGVLMSSLPASAAPPEDPPPETVGSFEPVPFTTIEQGQAGRFGEGDAGGQPVFKDPETWKAFWEAFTEGRDPRPELPDVDFNQDMIIVSSLGEVSGVYVDRNQGIVRVSAGDVERSDSSSATTTPFQIIKTERLEFQSIVFEHQKPPKGPVTGEETPNGADFNATATPDAQTQDFSVAAPGCVYLYQWDEWRMWRGWSSWARAINNCGHAERFRMIWAWAPDGSCRTVFNDWMESRRGEGPYVSELRSC